MVKIVLIVYSLIFVIFGVFGKKYPCQLNQTIYLKKNEIIFFESKYFPLANPIQATQKLNCKLNISLESQNLTSVLIIVYNEIIFEPYYLTHFFVLNDSFSLSPNSGIDDTKIAVQGFALHEDLSDNHCPLESIAGKEPFEISDETEIIYIRSHYYENEVRHRPCKWKFKATIQYGVKIVIETLNTTSKFVVRNSTDLYLVNDLVIPNHAFYNQDNYIEISLSNGNQINQSMLEFQAYISIFKKQYHTVDANCTIDERGYWSNNVINGYKNNAKCSYYKSILPNHGIHVMIDQYILETGVDYVYYYIEGENTSTILTFDGFNTKQGFVIEGEKNDVEKHAVFEFVSDGSVQYSGFGISFQDYVCQCSIARIIFCNIGNEGSVKTIMDNTDYYCGELVCHFVFNPCERYFLVIEISSTLNDVEDIFKFLSNDETVLEINKDNRMFGAFQIYFNPANKNELEVVTFSSIAYRTFSMYYVVEGFEINSVAVLSEQMPSYFIGSVPQDIEYGTVAVIEMAEAMASKNISFVIYASRPMADRSVLFQLYNNESLSINLSKQNCFTGENPYKCVLNVKKFVVYFKTSSTGFVVDLGIRLSKKPKGCVFEENVFDVKDIDEYQTVAALANSDDQCIVKLLTGYSDYNNNGYVITHLWTTASKENIKVYIGNDTKHLFFEFNSKTMNKWNDIRLYSPTFVITVPQNSAVFIVLKGKGINEYGPRNPDTDCVTISQFPYISIIASINFGTLRIHDTHHTYFPFVNYNIGNYSVKFTAFYYNMLPDDFLYFMVNYDIHNLNTTIAFGEEITFRNQNISLIYNRVTSYDGTNGFIFYLETLLP